MQFKLNRYGEVELKHCPQDRIVQHPGGDAHLMPMLRRCCLTPYPVVDGWHRRKGNWFSRRVVGYVIEEDGCMDALREFVRARELATEARYRMAMAKNRAFNAASGAIQRKAAYRLLHP